jgi:hypothetical protein
LPASTAERIGPSNIDQSEVGWVIHLARQLVEPPNPKKPTAREEQLGFGTAKAVIASEGCDGTRIHAVGSLARAGS